MKRILELALGIVTSIGGFLEVGSLATSAQAGASFRYSLIWAVVIGVASLALLMEMTGRLAAVSKRTYADQLRERFGIKFFLFPLVTTVIVSFLVLASEIGGVSLALQMATGIAARVWALPVALVGWLFLWRHSFELVEQGSALLGLVALVFAVAVVKLHPAWGDVARGIVPSAPSDDAAHYWLLAVSVLGASISPYLYIFYSAGAIEDEWDESFVGMNRIVAGMGNVFGGALSVAVVIVAAIVFAPRHIQIDQYEQMGLMLGVPLGKWGFALFLATLGVTCFGSTMELALSVAYLFAQGLGWEWSENEKPGENARFATTYTLLLVLGGAAMATGIDVLKLTNISMLLTAATLPVSVIPLFVLMNDETVMTRHRNGWASNIALGLISVMSIVVLFAAIPLQLLGGG